MGRFSIHYGGVPVDFSYHPIEGAKTTVVMFHGSTKKDVSLPMLAGAGITKGLPVNRLAISDPSLTLDDSHELILSWFAGSSIQPKLQHFLEAVVRRVTEVTGAPSLIFMGGSGGGFASLEMSRRFPGSLALAMNPQTVLTRYYSSLVTRYLDLCWDGSTSLSDLPCHVTHNIPEAYPRVLNHTVAYIQNTRDKHHVENHQAPFLERAGESDNVFMLMGAWGDPAGKGHVQAPREFIRNILHRLVESDGAWSSCLEDLGFSRNTTPDAAQRAVEAANAGLPKQHEVDSM